jgi:RNA polymerase sigma-70 factor (ECF subfamily)
VAAARVNPEAFTLLYRRYLQPVHRYCYLRLGRREAAEDATSEVFLKALSSLEGYRGGAIGGWLFRIAHNVVTDQHRARRHRFVVPLDAAGELRDPSAQPEVEAVSQSEIATVRAALATLTPDQRALVELQLAGLPTDEIAAALGRSQGAARVLRYRAHQALREALAEPVAPRDPQSRDHDPRKGGVRC